MKELSIDIETYSSVDLTKSGVYAYADAPDFTILLFAYAFDDEDVKITDIAQGETLPPEVIEALTDKSITKTAYNANFERVCLSAFYKTEMPPEQWRCSCIQAAELGLPSRLAGVAEALGLEQQKDQRGKSLINYFSKPVKAKGDDTLIRHMPSDAPDKWQIFKDYCKQDVEVERALYPCQNTDRPHRYAVCFHSYTFFTRFYLKFQLHVHFRADINVNIYSR